MTKSGSFRHDIHILIKGGYFTPIHREGIGEGGGGWVSFNPLPIFPSPCSPRVDTLGVGKYFPVESGQIFMIVLILTKERGVFPLPKGGIQCKVLLNYIIKTSITWIHGAKPCNIQAGKLIYTLESSFHYKRGFFPLILFVGGPFAPIFMVTWFGRYNYSLWGPNFHCFYSTTSGFRDLDTLHIFPISNQSIDFWSMKDWCNEHCIWQAWPSGIYLCSCKISKQNIR